MENLRVPRVVSWRKALKIVESLAENLGNRFWNLCKNLSWNHWKEWPNDFLQESRKENSGFKFKSSQILVVLITSIGDNIAEVWMTWRGVSCWIFWRTSEKSPLYDIQNQFPGGLAREVFQRGVLWRSREWLPGRLSIVTRWKSPESGSKEESWGWLQGGIVGVASCTILGES